MEIERLIPNRKYYKIDGFNVVWFKFLSLHPFNLGITIIDYEGKAMFVRVIDLVDWQIFEDDIEALKSVINKLRCHADYIETLIKPSENED